MLPFLSYTSFQHMPALVSVHLIGGRDRHLSKLQRMKLASMTRQEAPPLLTLSGALVAPQRVRVGHISLSDRCRRPVGREKRKNRDVSFLGHAPYSRSLKNPALQELVGEVFEAGLCEVVEAVYRPLEQAAPRGFRQGYSPSSFFGYVLVLA